jgi:hypothetical protein
LMPAAGGALYINFVKPVFKTGSIPSHYCDIVIQYGITDVQS